MRVRHPQRVQRGAGMIDHALHGVAVIGLRIVGMALADLVDGEDVVALGQRVEIGVPVERAVGGVGRAGIAAVEQHQRRSVASLVVTGVDAVDIDEFALVHRHGDEVL